MHWTEDAVEAFRTEGHEVRLLATRNHRLNKSLEQVLFSNRLGAPLAAWIARAIRKFAPDLILAIAVDDRCPPVILETISSMPSRPPLIAWIGDTFDSNAVGRLSCCDVVAYTDTGMLELHRRFGVRARAEFVPLAAPPERHVGQGGSGPRIAQLAFVGQLTANRVQVLKQLRLPVALYGPDWRNGSEVAHHDRHPRRVAPDELTEIYARHMAVLNIRNERHVLHGLNQRNFTPYVYSTPVITDPQPDLELCFEPGREVLVYNDPEHLNEIHESLRRDPALAAEIGRKGQQRVRAQHMYAHRLRTFCSFI